ncbi:MAG: DUF2150 family protein, partial [Archaeoglobaceae archaeon]
MEFYSETRLQNWINKINESKVSEDDPTTLIVFDQMLEDVIIACFNIVNAVKDREIRKAEALKETSKDIAKIEEKVNRGEKLGKDEATLYFTYKLFSYI